MKRASIYRRLVIGAVLGLVAFLTAVPGVALAIAQPDSPPALTGTAFYENLLTAGDGGILMRYFLDYAALPTETATDAYLAVFVDTDGTTQLKAAAPYVYATSGYGYGYLWIYFTPAEMTAYSIDSADQALYRVWLIGNPALTWGGSGVPPKTVSTVDYWQPSGTSTAPLFALRVLDAANQLELEWGVDLVEASATGNKLTATGEDYFSNVIPNLRLMAPGAFASSTETIVPYDIDLVADYSAEATGGIVVGTPVTIASGGDTVTLSGAGTFTLDLGGQTYGTVTTDTAVVVGSPLDVVAGTNTVTVLGAGDVTVTVALHDAATESAAAIAGTAFDVTPMSSALGISNWWITGGMWLVLGFVLLGIVVGGSKKNPDQDYVSTGGGKVLILVLTIWLMVGIALHFVHPVVGELMIVGFGTLVFWLLFLNNSEGTFKIVLFFLCMTVIVFPAAFTFRLGFGTYNVTGAKLTTDVTAVATTLDVTTTTGFPLVGVVTIDGEQVRYTHKTATTLTGLTAQALTRGFGGTTAAAHLRKANVRPVVLGAVNDSLETKVANISDSSGINRFIAIADAAWSVLGSLFKGASGLPGEMAVFTVLWLLMVLGFFISLGLSMAGSRRV